MNLKTLFFYLLFVMFYSCNTSSKHFENNKIYTSKQDFSSYSDSDNRRHDLYYYDSLFSGVDRISMNSLVDTFKLNKVFNDSIELLLFHNDEYPIKLVYTVLGDDGLRNGIGSYYFDNSGRLIGKRIGNFYTFFDKNDSVILFERQSQNLALNSIEQVGKLSKIAIAAREVSSYMQFFTKIKYINIRASEKSIPTLKVKSDEIELKTNPALASKTIKRLKHGTHLVYISSTNNTENINGKSWIWYKVMTEDKIQGWIFAYPSIIEDLNDENYSD